MPSTEAGARFGPELRAQLLEVAFQSIAYGLEHSRPLPVDAAAYPEALRAEAASFVTLHLGGELRGCIGALAARRPLVADVCEHAYAAAFQDPRFLPVSAAELPHVHIEVSVLSAPAPIETGSEADLLRQLRPGRDGLIVEDERHRGTFLPAVWKSLPEPAQFLRHLKLKAGLAADYWSPGLRFSRYTTESFGAPVAEIRAGHSRHA
jgi:AmmeMemoRadiSam system protein A